ncbi:TetR family transcriptional regulator [Pseudonocardia sediminis]|uniref:TetR family transcriptional regulator n=1 Tax=Pseudonocardia sediminis TaxID=1397368 RepID=A0A4Q7US97_PSEST|nr:TetR/AcrR family transcriptional regulator [Pseudonocardia sediminis]RZT84565.1 TetR family transcriptional regulator [Pseudonocardia sediminis]
MDGDIGGDVLESVLDAGLQLWSDSGWTAVTLPAACAAAGVPVADLAEDFPDSLDLLCEVFDRSTDERASAVITAMDAAPHDERLRAGMRAFVACIDRDPRHAAVLVEAVGCPELRARRRSSFRGFAALMASQVVGTAAEPRRLQVAAHFCLGGLTEMTLAWLDSETDVDRELVLEHGARMFEVTMTTP